PERPGGTARIVGQRAWWDRSYWTAAGCSGNPPPGMWFDGLRPPRTETAARRALMTVAVQGCFSLTSSFGIQPFRLSDDRDSLALVFFVSAFFLCFGLCGPPPLVMGTLPGQACDASVTSR